MLYYSASGKKNQVIAMYWSRPAFTSWKTENLGAVGILHPGDQTARSLEAEILPSDLCSSTVLGSLVSVRHANEYVQSISSAKTSSERGSLHLKEGASRGIKSNSGDAFAGVRCVGEKPHWSRAVLFNEADESPLHRIIGMHRDKQRKGRNRRFFC